jgi:hypothetical protein
MASTPSQSPHSEYFFNFGDKAGRASFIIWHHLRHHTYDLLASRAGQTLPPLDLKGNMDKDWLLRHSTRHSTHRRISGIITHNGGVGLNTVNLEEPIQHADWLHIHALEHAKLDSYYGLP